MKARGAGRIVRAVSWLLTPVVVWAASFCGGWLAALVADALRVGEQAVVWLVSGGIVGGVAGLAAWVLYLRRPGVRPERAKRTTSADRTSPN